MTGRFKFVSEIKEANRKSGRYFFEADTMRFFRSKVATYYVWDGRYFITSEQNVWFDEHHQRHAEPRRFSIREAHDDGDIDTVGEFQAWATLAQARQAVNRLLIRQGISVPRPCVKCLNGASTLHPHQVITGADSADWKEE